MVRLNHAERRLLRWWLDAAALLVVVAMSVAAVGCDASPEGEENMDIAVTPLAGEPGEQWGGFVFYSASVPFRATQTPGPAQPVPFEESIPYSHPGLRRFDSPEAALAAIGGGHGVVDVGRVPPGYELLAVWAIEHNGQIIDFVVEYARVGVPTVPLSPHLSVGWTLRAPRPLPALAEINRLPSGQAGEPVVKVTVRGERGVFQEWKNTPGAPIEAGVRSSLNWFDETGRLWFVQAYDEPLSMFLEVAEGLLVQ
jgi:hypothetical protein